MMKILLNTYLNCGNAQARKRNRRPMEPLKARATKAEIENYDVDPVARMESFRALKHKDPNGVFPHPETLTIGEF